MNEPDRIANSVGQYLYKRGNGEIRCVLTQQEKEQAMKMPLSARNKYGTDGLLSWSLDMIDL